jgi:hypothetical protein
MSKNNKSGYDLRARGILALVGMGDVNALKYQLNLGAGAQLDLDAYAFALAGIEDPEGQKILESMKDHEHKQVRDAVKNAFLQLEKWNREKAQGSNSTSSDGDTYVDRHIASQGHLIHKIKAKDSTDRWAYYFVLVQPNLEQIFLQSLESKQSIDLEEYGEIIASCYGESPDEKTKIFLKEKYGFDV